MLFTRPKGTWHTGFLLLWVYRSPVADQKCNTLKKIDFESYVFLVTIASFF